MLCVASIDVEMHFACPNPLTLHLDHVIHAGPDDMPQTVVQEQSKEHARPLQSWQQELELT